MHDIHYAYTDGRVSGCYINGELWTPERSATALRLARLLDALLASASRAARPPALAGSAYADEQRKRHEL